MTNETKRTATTTTTRAVLVGIDLETSGSDCLRHGIVGLGMVAVDAETGGVLDTYDSGWLALEPDKSWEPRCVREHWTRTPALKDTQRRLENARRYARACRVLERTGSAAMAVSFATVLVGAALVHPLPVAVLQEVWLTARAPYLFWFGVALWVLRLVVAIDMRLRADAHGPQARSVQQAVRDSDAFLRRQAARHGRGSVVLLTDGVSFDVTFLNVARSECGLPPLHLAFGDDTFQDVVSTDSYNLGAAHSTAVHWARFDGRRAPDATVRAELEGMQDAPEWPTSVAEHHAADDARCIAQAAAWVHSRLVRRHARHLVAAGS